MLTEEETRLLAHAYALRHDEPPGRDVWFCPDNLLFAEAARLWERGWLDRRWHRYRRRLRKHEDLVYRLSDQAMTAQELTRLTSAASPN